MSWPLSIIGDYFQVKHGFALKGDFFGNDGEYIVVTPGNFHEVGGFRHRGDKEKFYTQSPPDDFILACDDLIIAMTEQGEGLLGSSALVPSDDRYLHNQRIGLVTDLDESKLDKRFLCYLLNTLGVRAQIRATATGTKVKHTAPKRIRAVKSHLPPVPIQTRIADILSAYDDLIANNNRRMALLEDAIHLLYREWFVYLRFPGHERVKVVDGLPEGWERKPLRKCFTLNYGKSLPKKIRDAGDFPVYGSSGVVGTHKTALVTGPGLIVGRKGNVGTVFWCETDFFPIDTTYFISAEETSLFIYSALKSLVFVSSDAAVPGLNRNYAYSKEILVPTDGVKNEFEVIVRKHRDQLNNLENQNQRCREARDLLLPRFMDGRLPV